GFVLAALLVPVVPAAADPLDSICEEVPAPVRPDFQTAGLVMDKPDPATIPERAPDPFADPNVPISSVYGWAWRYTNYDLGCGSDFIRDPSAVASTNLANIAMAGLATMTSSVESVENMSRSANFDFFEPVVASVANTLDERILTVWLPLALLVVSIVLAFSAVRATYSETFRRLMVVVICVALAVVALVFPVRATEVMDEGAKAVSSAAQAGFNPRASDLITRESLYKTWLVGNFGSADSPTAVEYGPRLMSALTYTWSDVEAIKDDPDRQEDIDKAKAAEFKKIAEEVEKKDPAAYASLTGKTDTRTAGTILGAVWVAIMGFFVALAALITILARLIMIALVLAAMVGTVVGVVQFAVLQRMWDLFTAAIINIVKFTIAAGVMTLILGAIQTADVGTGWRLLFAIVATVIAIMITKPIQSFKSMAGLDPTRSYLSALLRRAGGTALGVVAGNRLSQRDDADRGPGGYPGMAPVESGVTYRVQPVEPSMPPLPSPQAVPTTAYGSAGTIGWAGAERLAGAGPRPALEGSRRSAPEPVRTSPNALPPEPEIVIPPENPPQLRPVTVVPIVPGVDLRRPVVAEQTTLSVGAPAPPTDPARVDPGPIRVGSSVDPGPAERTPRLTIASAATSAAPGDHTTRVTPVEPPPVARPVEPAVYPTGIVVQNEPGVYRTGGQFKVDEYVRFPEPQVDANGEETWTPLYHAAKAKAR
ncbi:MAG TPA: hypothetical protein VK401_08175, partial [Propionibacteriaceae bacterium]|nr:hypothetical protein [Propionibacteriaceae bacterium]